MAYTGRKRVVEVKENNVQLYPGNRIRVVCDPGYVLTDGGEYSFCLTDGVWSNPVGRCISLTNNVSPPMRFPELIPKKTVVPVGAGIPIPRPVWNKYQESASTSTKLLTSTTTSTTTTTTTTRPTTTERETTTTESPTTTTQEIPLSLPFRQVTLPMTIQLGADGAFIGNRVQHLKDSREDEAKLQPVPVAMRHGLFAHCGTVPDIVNGIVSNGSSMAGAARQITCNQGFVLTGIENITCSDQGLWLVNSMCSRGNILKF